MSLSKQIIMTNHTDLLNYLATTFNLQSYLEIGVSIPADNFDKIVCESKWGVDPNVRDIFVSQMTSDEFFEGGYINGEKLDLIFIDGLHHADQVKRDFENSLNCLNDNGFIVIHDTLPEKEEYTHVPRDSKIWNGNVYEFAITLANYENIYFTTLQFDHGCTVITKEKKCEAVKVHPIPPHLPSAHKWQIFQEHKYLLMPIEVNEFKHLMERLRDFRLNIK